MDWRHSYLSVRAATDAEREKIVVAASCEVAGAASRTSEQTTSVNGPWASIMPGGHSYSGVIFVNHRGSNMSGLCSLPVTVQWKKIATVWDDKCLINCGSGLEIDIAKTLWQSTIPLITNLSTKASWKWLFNCKKWIIVHFQSLGVRYPRRWLLWWPVYFTHGRTYSSASAPVWPLRDPFNRSTHCCHSEWWCCLGYRCCSRNMVVRM